VYFNKYSGNNQTEIQKLNDVIGDGFGPTANITQKQITYKTGV
jgi:hypothetical protein